MSGNDGVILNRQVTRSEEDLKPMIPGASCGAGFFRSREDTRDAQSRAEAGGRQQAMMADEGTGLGGPREIHAAR
jgi:hypothetical protein